MRVRSVKGITDLPRLAPADRVLLEEVSKRYVFRANDYYLGLIDWSDPDDPIKRLVVPDSQEMSEWGTLDASNEQAVTVARGVQHKYPHTVLLLVNEVCSAYCRYCFRKRLFMNGNDEANLDVSQGLAYVRAHPSVTDVLLTGGDPLIMSTRRILRLVAALREIPHVSTVRIGTKMPAFNPWRVLDDPELVEGFSHYSTSDKRIYLMAHFDHPRELTGPALHCLDVLIRAGVICLNQNPLIRGINDDPDVMAELYRKLSFIGVPPYYLFQGRPTAGNEPYQVPIVEGHRIFEAAKRQLSGLAKRARFAMSHETGKIEIVGVDQRYVYLRYHQAKDPADEGRFAVFHRNDEAYWLDGLRPVDGTHAPRSATKNLAEVGAGPE